MRCEKNEDLDRDDHYVKVTIDIVIPTVVRYKMCFDVSKRLARFYYVCERHVVNHKSTIQMV